MDKQIYFNLNKKVWSIRDRKTQKVEAHTESILLTGITRYAVQSGGRKRVLKQKCKNVHAFIQGNEISSERPNYDVNDRIYYCPYKLDRFMRQDVDGHFHEIKDNEFTAIYFADNKRCYGVKG